MKKDTQIYYLLIMIYNILTPHCFCVVSLRAEERADLQKGLIFYAQVTMHRKRIRSPLILFILVLQLTAVVGNSTQTVRRRFSRDTQIK
jgi:hypothetical protein